MSLTLAQRREILASMPWVAVSPGPQIWDKRCEGIKVDAPMYAWRDMSEVERQARYGCLNRARWVFLGLDGRIHIYCWSHLFVYGFQGSRSEEERYNAWLTKYMETHPVPPDWDDEERDEPLGRS
jgi:hypothetical protein